MKFHTTAGAIALAIGLSTTGSAVAAPMLGINVYDNNVLIGSQTLIAGGSAFLNVADTAFTSIFITASGIPNAPDPNLTSVSIDTTVGNISSAHTLTIQVTQTGVSGVGFGGLASTFNYNGLFNPGNITFAVGANYVDQSNTAFAKTTLIGASADFGGQVLGSAGPLTYMPTPAPLFSETQEFVLTFIGQATANTSSQIVGVPEPLSLSVLAAGLIGLGLVRRKRTTAAA